MNKFLLSVIFAATVTTGFAQTQATVACSDISLGAMGSLNGFVPSPSDAWHQNISQAPIDHNSDKILRSGSTNDLIGAHLHPDFGSVAGGNYGIPYTVVDSATMTSVPLTWTEGYQATEGDTTLYPIPQNLQIEGTPAECPSGGDRHAIVIDRNKCVVYEMYETGHCGGGWVAGNGTLWDMTIAEKRPYGSTSVDAAGLSVFEGLIRYDEVAAGAINHAIRFTSRFTKNDANNGYFAAPATHASGNNWGNDMVMGLRIRLRADFNVSGFSKTNQIILTAMKQYGMILADNGSDMFFQGTPDKRWNDDDLNMLKSVPSSAFDVLEMGTVHDGRTAPTGVLPAIVSFTASATHIAKGGSTVLSSKTTDTSYSFIDNVGFVRGPVTVSPTATTTYTQTSRNAFGSATASVTVIVSNTLPKVQFDAIPTQTYGIAKVTVHATSTATEAITYNVVSGPASVAGDQVTLTGTGRVTLQATQVHSGLPVTAETSFLVDPAVPTLAFVPIADCTDSTMTIKAASVSNSSGATTYSVLSGPALVTGNTITVQGAGRVTLHVDQVAAGSYTAASASTMFNVSSGPYMLTTSYRVPGGRISVRPPSRTGLYPKGTVLRVRAMPDRGYKLANWTGTVADSTAIVTTMTMDGPNVLTAHFVPVVR